MFLSTKSGTGCFKKICPHSVYPIFRFLPSWKEIFREENFDLSGERISPTGNLEESLQKPSQYIGRNQPVLVWLHKILCIFQRLFELTPIEKYGILMPESFLWLTEQWIYTTREQEAEVCRPSGQCCSCSAALLFLIKKAAHRAVC